MPGDRWDMGRKMRMGIAGKGAQSHGRECGLYPGPGILDLSSGQVGIIKPALYFKKI